MSITIQRMDRFLGQSVDVLIEKQNVNSGGTADTENAKMSNSVPHAPLWLGRLYCHAPEVDGVALVSGGAYLKPGDIAPCTVIARRGFDLDVRISQDSARIYP